MDTDLQRTLRGLCFRTEWSYAVFWKLKHRARMVLTWEDAYYENCEPHDPFENKCFKETLEKVFHGNYSHDPLGLAVAKMSYHVYSLGEGIVGQVAVTGKHQWIIADEDITSSISSLEFSDGWQSQISAGIKTIVVVAVVPYGVVQLGSFNKVPEDLKLVTHIRDLFSSIQDCSVGPSTTQLQYDFKNPPYLETEPEIIRDSLPNLSKATVTNRSMLCDVLTSESFPDSILCNGSMLDGINAYTSINSILDLPKSSNVSLKKDTDQTEYQGESSHLDPPNTFLKFSAGFELHEALGPAFSKRCLYLETEAAKTEPQNIVEMPEGKSAIEMSCDSGPENLLEAVVASVCYSDKSGSKSSQSLLTSAEKKPSSSSSINEHSVMQEDTKRCSSSVGIGGAMSSRGFSSDGPSGCSELDRHSEPVKNSKKRARPGESGRPRPRDRQLIQDRIKELRELIPNGAKCSIDSLLERTIKHMIFMESITKHAEKLNKCAESKRHRRDSSNYEKGSSWAVEVGGHLKVSSIVVENLDKDGQVLVEMLCEECSHFLEIAEAIRGLGLTILKGTTEAHGDKTWICFLVEGQSNRVMHRMDVLWSLVQILQPKTSSN